MFEQEPKRLNLPDIEDIEKASVLASLRACPDIIGGQSQ
jgi:hypothetical protein